MPSTSTGDVAGVAWPARSFPARWGAAAWVATGLGFLLLTVAVVRGGTASWDATVTAEAVSSRTPTLTAFAVAVSWLGNAGPLVAWSVVAALVLDRWRRTSWRCLLRVALVLLVEVAVVAVVKNAVERPRPPSELWLVRVSTYSFPSGHTTATAAVVAMLLLCLVALPGSRRARSVAMATGVLWVAAMAWSRVYLGVHYISDVVAGVLLGVWLALSVVWVVDKTVQLRREATRIQEEPS